MYASIGGLSVLVMIVAAICNDITDSLVSDIVKNLAFGCVASTIVAFLIEIGNIKEKNEKANSVYDAVYGDLQYQILSYVETWARLCSVAFNDEDYRNKKHTWIEWYEIVRNKFAECDDTRQKELMNFFNEQLIDSIDGIEKSLNQINSQRYMLTINEVYDESLRRILSDYRFEFYGVKSILKESCDKDQFWDLFDAIKLDLEKYIYNWIDIRHYNYYRFTPSNFYDKEEMLHAVQECNK